MNNKLRAQEDSQKKPAVFEMLRKQLSGTESTMKEINDMFYSQEQVISQQNKLIEEYQYTIKALEDTLNHKTHQTVQQLKKRVIELENDLKEAILSNGDMTRAYQDMTRAFQQAQEDVQNFAQGQFEKFQQVLGGGSNQKPSLFQQQVQQIQNPISFKPQLLDSLRKHKDFDVEREEIDHLNQQDMNNKSIDNQSRILEKQGRGSEHSIASRFLEDNDQKYDKLQKEVNQSMQEITQKSKLNEELVHTNSGLQREILVLQDQIKKDKTKMDSLDKQLKFMQNDKEFQQSQINQMSQKLEEAKSLNQSLKNILTDKDSQLSQMIFEVEFLKNQNQAVGGETKDWLKRLQELTDEKLVLSKQLLEVEKQVKNEKDSNEKNQREINYLQKQKVILEQSVEQISKDQLSLQGQLRALGKVIIEKDAHISSLNFELESLKSQGQKKVDEMVSKFQDMLNNDQLLEDDPEKNTLLQGLDQKKRFDDLRALKQQLIQQIDDLNQEVDDINAEKLNFAEIIEKSRQKLQEITLDNTNVKEDLANLEIINRGLFEEWEAYQNQKADLESKLNVIKEEVYVLSQSKEDFERKLLDNQEVSFKEDLNLQFSSIPKKLFEDKQSQENNILEHSENEEVNGQIRRCNYIKKKYKLEQTADFQEKYLQQLHQHQEEEGKMQEELLQKIQEKNYLVSELEHNQSELDTLQPQLERALQEFQERNNYYSGLVEELEEVKQAIKKTQKDYEFNKQMLEDIESSNDQLTSQMDNLKEILERKRESYLTKEKELHNYQKEYNYISLFFSISEKTIQQKIDDQSTSLLKLYKVHDDMIVKINRGYELSQDLENKIQTLEDNNRELTKSLQTKVNMNSSRK